MNLLKKLASVLLKATQIVAGFAPVVEATVPQSNTVVQTVSQDLTQIANIIVQVEAIGTTLGQAGPQKLQAAAPLVAQVILQSSLMVGHSIADPVLFQKAAGEIAGGVADLLNSLKGDVATTDKAA